MAAAVEPRPDLAAQILPAPLFRALCFIFEQGVSDCMLVGGTALSGFYAGHRRSDDLDLFTRSEPAQRAVELAAQALTELGATLSAPYRSRQYYHAGCALDGHSFTIDVVLDPNLFEVGDAHLVEPGLCVASLETLIAMKAAALVSRCGEKDLFDLLWILQQQELSIAQLLEAGEQIDGGVNAEAVLESLTGAQLSVLACGFGLRDADNPERIFAEVSALRDELLASLSALLHTQAAPPLSKAVRKIRRWNRS